MRVKNNADEVLHDKPLPNVTWGEKPPPYRTNNNNNDIVQGTSPHSRALQ